MRLKSLLRLTASALVIAGAMTGSATSARAEETINIGFITASSGPLKTYGEPTSVTVNLAVKEINDAGGIGGKKIKLFEYDTSSDPKQASVGVRTMAQDDHVLAIIGPLSSGETAVAMNDAERLGVLIMPTSASTPGLTKGKTFTWRLTASEDLQFGRLMRTLKRKDIPMNSAEVVYVSDERVSNVTGTQLYPPILKEFGVKAYDPISVNFASFDVSAQVAQIVKNAPDLVPVAATLEPAARVLRELKRENYKGRMIGSQIFGDPDLIDLFGHDADGTLFVSGFWWDRDQKTREFQAKYIAAMKEHGMVKRGAHHAFAQAYDTVYLLKQAIEAAKVTNDPAKLTAERVAVRDALKGVRFSGVLGDNICFNGNDASLPGYIIELKNADWTLFDQWAAEACPA